MELNIEKLSDAFKKVKDVSKEENVYYHILGSTENRVQDFSFVVLEQYDEGYIYHLRRRNEALQDKTYPAKRGGKDYQFYKSLPSMKKAILRIIGDVPVTRISLTEYSKIQQV